MLPPRYSIVRNRQSLAGSGRKMFQIRLDICQHGHVFLPVVSLLNHHTYTAASKALAGCATQTCCNACNFDIF